MTEQTDPLVNGAALPDHPATTTARKIISYGKVTDATDGKPLRGGLHQNEIVNLMNGSQMALGHLYAYVILNGHIYHTRPSVIITVETEDVTDG